MTPEIKKPEGEEVVEETINAYRVQRHKNGSISIRSGGHVVHAPTYFEALERYAASEKQRVEESSEHLREDKRNSIYDGVIPLYSLDTSGFTPEEILDAVTGQPLERVLSFMDSEENDG